MNITTDFAREVACAIIRQAHADATCTKEFQTKQCQEEQERNRDCAIRFFRGAWYKHICEALDLPACSIKRNAFK
jgi:hypothetical protein